MSKLMGFYTGNIYDTSVVDIDTIKECCRVLNYKDPILEDELSVVLKQRCIGCNSCEESQKDLNKDNKDKLIDDLNYILKENFEYVPLYKVINIADELIKRGWNFDKQIKE